MAGHDYILGSGSWMVNPYDPNQMGNLLPRTNTGGIMPGSIANLAQNSLMSTQNNDPGFWKQLGNILGSDKFTTGMSAFGNLAGIYTGFKSLGLAEDQLDFSKYSFSKNFNAQAQTYNNTLRDQWASRSAAAANRGEKYEAMNSWMEPRQIEKV